MRAMTLIVFFLLFMIVAVLDLARCLGSQVGILAIVLHKLLDSATARLDTVSVATYTGISSAVFFLLHSFSFATVGYHG